MPAGWTESDINAQGILLHVRQVVGEGDPLLLLHGLGASGVVWQVFGRRLAPRWRAIAPDLRGHGQSDQPFAGYQAEDYASDLTALIRTLGLRRVPVIGHSLGALVTLALAAAAPQFVTAAVLLDPPLDPDRPNPDIEQVYRLRNAPPGELEAYLPSPILAPVFRQASDAAFEAVLDAPRGAPWAWTLAPSIQIRTLIVQADPANGGMLGDQAARDFAAHLPQATLTQVPGASHALHASHGPQVAQLVLDFLAANARCAWA